MDHSRWQPPASKSTLELQRRILVVEDDRGMRELLWRLLPDHGWSVTTAADGLTALQLLESQRFDAILADERLPGPHGIRVLEHARHLHPDTKLVLYGGWLGHDSRERAKAIGALCVTKGATDSIALLLTVLDDA